MENITTHATIPVPNPHQDDISVGLLSRILRQAGVDRQAWIDAE
jgi:hypothetical protein